MNCARETATSFRASIRRCKCRSCASCWRSAGKGRELIRRSAAGRLPRRSRWSIASARRSERSGSGRTRRCANC